MESNTLLDYALFQLTPTRTRCDLVIFAGKKKEKIATGLLEPYVSHLKSAKDQISKGGYSITLRPNDSSSWFTKATLQRFVRFVSTPEVVERFVTIEREMDQIESSNGTVELPAGKASSTDRSLRVHQCTDIEAEETPKIRLQRVLEARKAMLKKEQAMAYARALVAGFEMDNLCDLVSFSDAFGAQRLREACVNFMELCNKKNEDKIWMDEVAAMQASYLGTPENHDPSQVGSLTGHGGMDTSEGTDNGFPTDLNPQQADVAAQLPTWPHHHPHYTQHSQAPMFQPYPGYIFPGMQAGPSHYPGNNMPWPANVHNPGTPRDTNIKDSQKKKKSHRKKEKHADTKSVESSDDTDHSSSRSNSSDEQINNKKHNKKSSRKVVIRNINYIASSRNETDSNGSESYSSDESLKRHHKPNSNKSKKAIDRSKDALDAENEGTLVVSEEEKKDGNWDIFQNLLMREPDSNSADTDSKSIHIQEECTDNKSHTGSKFASDDFLFTERSNRDGFSEGEYYPQKDHFSTEHSTVKTREEEDWVVSTKSDTGSIPVGNNTNTDDHNIFSGDQALANINVLIGENRKDVLSDDSFMVQSRVSDGPQLTQPKLDDIFMVTDITGSNQSKNNNMAGNSNSYEPEDLKMMLGHDPVTEQAVASWSHDMETTDTRRIKSEPSDPIVVDDAKQQLGNGKASKTGTNKDSGRKVGGKESKSKAPSGSLGRSKSDVPPRSKISNSGSTMSRSKSGTEEDKRKKMEELSKQRQKRIAERSAAKGIVTPETSRRSTKEVKKTTPSIPSKDKPRAPTDQENKKSPKPVTMRSSTIDRLATSRTTKKPSLSTEPKVGQNKKPPPSAKKTKGAQEQHKVKVNPSDKKNGSKNNNNNPKIISSDKLEKAGAKNGIVEDSESTAKVLHTVSSVEKKEADSTISDNVIKGDDRAVGLTTTQITVNPTHDVNDEKPIGEKKKLTFSPEISVLEIPSSTPPPPPDNETSLEPSRKKWNNGESSPKIPKGFRRLLLFGRRA